MSVEDSYFMGMKYSDAPLDAGFAKLLVNYSFSGDGFTMTPRLGLQCTYNKELETSSAAPDLDVYYIGDILIEDVATSDVRLKRIVILGPKDQEVSTGINFDEAIILVESTVPEVTTLELNGFDYYSDSSIFASFETSVLDSDYTADYVLRHQNNLSDTRMHDTLLENPSPTAYYSELNGNVYFLTDAGIGHLIIHYDDETYYHNLVLLEPDEITPTQALNYGYNMADDDPYVFENVAGASLSLQGVLPYDSSDLLKLNAKVGEELLLRLVYTYPDSTPAPTYKVQWEIQDLLTDKTARVLQAVDDSPTYTAGDDITFEHGIEYKQFSIIIKVYDSTDTSEPLKVAQLAAYNTASDEAQKYQSRTPKNFNLTTATGMLTWNTTNQVVLWGVAEAGTTLFISDINNPQYFPFPHNIHSFNEEILRVINFLDSLLVFTSTRLHIINVNLEGSGYIVKTIQENLNIGKNDVRAIKIVKNMIFFKSNNYYYMMVPSIISGPGELKLAPISQNIETFIDNFENNVKNIVDETYNVAYNLGIADTEWQIRLQDFYNNLDTYKIRNVYKYKLTVTDQPDRFFEIVLEYDTVVRNWLLHIYETNDKPIVVYRKVVTESTTYLNYTKMFYQGGLETGNVQLLKSSPNNVVDDFNLDGLDRLFKNYQLLDTGKRAIQPHIKKRFREIVLVFNNVSGNDLEFLDSFIVDDSVRKGFFKYDVLHVTDPEADNYGQIYVERSYQDPYLIYGTTVLQGWKLDLSQFPKQTMVRVRLGVSGKGYAGQLKFISRNEQLYELKNINWVYRTQNAR